MPRIPTRSSPRGTPSALSGETPLPLSIAKTGGEAEAQALGTFGAGISALGSALGKIEQERQRMRNLSAVSDAEYQYERWQREYEKLAAEQEFPDQKSFDTWRRNYATALQEKEKQLLQGQNGRVQQRLGISFNEKRASYLDQMDTIILKQERQTYELKVPAQISQIIKDHYSSEVPESPEKLQEKLDLIVARNAHWFDEGQLQRIAIEQHAEVLSEMGRPDEARALVDSSDLFKETEKTTLKAHADTVSKGMSDVMEKELSDLMLRGELNTKELAVRTSRMTASAQKAWTQILLNQHAEGNPVLAADLANEATGIWEGSATLDQVELDSRNALARGDGINGTEYRQIMTAARSELKQAQAQALSLVYARAKSQLVSYGENNEAFAHILEGKSLTIQDLLKDTRKLEFWNLARYDDEMRQWIKDNPDKSGIEFQQHAEATLYDYMNRTSDDIEQLQKSRKELIQTEVLAENISDWTLDQIMNKLQDPTWPNKAQ